MKFTSDEVKWIFKQIMLGVEHLHTNKVIHRDIKPSNVLINSKLDVVLSDFDMARYLPESKEKLSNYLFTLNYRAPELFYGDKFYNEKIDVWSLGCLLIELNTLKTLFQSETEIRML